MLRRFGGLEKFHTIDDMRAKAIEMRDESLETLSDMFTIKTFREMPEGSVLV